MAAVAVASAAGGQTSKRKSRRALAQSFLSRISLDGNIVIERNEPASGTDNPLVEGELAENVEEEEEEENKLLTSEQPVDGSNSAKTITNNKPKFLHSVSENAASFDRDKGRMLRSRDSNSVSYSKTLLTPEVVVNFRRSYSMTESLMTDSSSSCSGNVHFNKGSIRHKITCMSGSSFKLRRKLHDKRIVLCSPRKVPFLTYSVLKYHKENKEVGVEGTGRKRASAPNTQYLGIEGVEIGTGDKTVSYSSLLVPSFTNIKYVGDAKDAIPLLMPSIDSPTDSCFDELESPIPTVDRYEPYKLDDPELTSGKHRTVLQLSSYMVSVSAYAKPSELKKDLNERFREKFPHIDITLTKLRSLKKDLLKIALSLDCQLDLTTVAYAYVYFEKLILKGKINKPNRKLVAGSCLLLAAKFNDDKRGKIKDVIEKIEDKLKTQVKELLSFEFQALVGLEFNLHLPTWEVIPHLRRLETEQQ